VKNLIGDSDNYDLNYLDYLAGQGAVVVLPFQREAFASQALDLS